MPNGVGQLIGHVDETKLVLQYDLAHQPRKSGGCERILLLSVTDWASGGKTCPQSRRDLVHLQINSPSDLPLVAIASPLPPCFYRIIRRTKLSPPSTRTQRVKMSGWGTEPAAAAPGKPIFLHPFISPSSTPSISYLNIPTQSPSCTALS